MGKTNSRKSSKVHLFAHIKKGNRCTGIDILRQLSVPSIGLGLFDLDAAQLQHGNSLILRGSPPSVRRRPRTLSADNSTSVRRRISHIEQSVRESCAMARVLPYQAHVAIFAGTRRLRSSGFTC